MSSGPARARRYWDAGGQTPGGQTAWKRELARSLTRPGAVVVDVGCGAGDSSPGGVIGMDADLAALRRARAAGVRPVACDAERRWPLRDGSVDAVLLFDVLEHVPDPDVLLAQAARVLRPGGLLLAAIPNAAHLANRVAALSGRTTDFTDAAHRRHSPISDHLHRLTLASAQQLLSHGGFTVEQMYPYAPESFTEGAWRRLSPLARLLLRLGLVRRLPSMLAYEFLFVCRWGPAQRAGPAPSFETSVQTGWEGPDPRYRGYMPDGEDVRLDHRVRVAVDLVAARTHGGVLVDLGGGDGYVTSAAKVAGGFRTAVCVDAALPKPLAEPPASAAPVAADLGAGLPLRDRCADVVLSLETIEHLLDPDAFLSECRRILRPGGVLVLSTPRLDSLLVIASLAAGLQPPGVDASRHHRYGNPLGEGRPSGHLHLFTRRALREALGNHGFVITAYREGRFSSSWRQARASRERRGTDRALEAAFAVYDLLPARKDVMIVSAVSTRA